MPHHSRTKLSEDAIYDISRNGYAENRAAMAKRYGVSEVYIQAIFNVSSCGGALRYSEPAVRGRRDRIAAEAEKTQ